MIPAAIAYNDDADGLTPGACRGGRAAYPSPLHGERTWRYRARGGLRARRAFRDGGRRLDAHAVVCLGLPGDARHVAADELTERGVRGAFVAVETNEGVPPGRAARVQLQPALLGQG